MHHKLRSPVLLAYGMLSLVLMLLYFVCIHWWFTQPMLDMSKQRSALIQEYTQMNNELLQRDVIQQQFFSAQQQSEGQAWVDADAGMVSAQLSQKLEQWLASSTMSCQSIARTPLQAQSSARFNKVVLQIRLRCGMQGLVNLMAHIEQDNSAVFIENFELATRRQLNAVDGQDAGLDVSMDIAVYTRQLVEGQ